MLQELAPCACGGFYAGGCGGRCAGAAASAFSMLFPAGAEQCYYYKEEEDGPPYGGGPVDCTLSLGTPSTRRAEAGAGAGGHARAAGGAAPCKESSGRGSPARRCANCDTTSTPLWRNGPRGPKVRARRSHSLISRVAPPGAATPRHALHARREFDLTEFPFAVPSQSLCNACGIRYKKEERRAAAAVAPAPAPQEYACGGYARQQPPQPQWGCYGAAAAKSASFGMYGGDVVDAAADGPCLSWMLNVMPSSPAFAVRERPTLFQYY